MHEKDIVTTIMKYIRSMPNSFCFKEHGGQFGTSGLPDIICCINGRFVAFEVKTPSGRLTKLQQTMIQRIRRAKGEAYKVTSVEDVKDILQNLDFLEE